MMGRKGRVEVPEPPLLGGQSLFGLLRCSIEKKREKEKLKLALSIAKKKPSGSRSYLVCL